jgi:hypothetical protein
MDMNLNLNIPESLITPQPGENLHEIAYQLMHTNYFAALFICQLENGGEVIFIRDGDLVIDVKNRQILNERAYWSTIGTVKSSRCFTWPGIKSWHKAGFKTDRAAEPGAPK